MVIMEISNLDQTELNKRANKVFDLHPGDYVYDIYIEDDGQVVVSMSEYAIEIADHVDFKYLPDMTERPQALDYLMGKRDDFND